MQKNWIGKSKGMHLTFDACETKDQITVYTTRPDTIFGASFVAIAADHPMAVQCSENNQSLRDFIEECRKLGTSEEVLEKAEKKGFKLDFHMQHPFIKSLKLPVYVANFVLMEYGTGAVFGCPAHDQRDLDFARKYDLNVQAVVIPTGEDAATFAVDDVAYTDTGLIGNSEFLDGMTVEAAKAKIIELGEKGGFGQAKTNFRLRDWGVSRQRYWGAPIPMVYCDDCGVVAVLKDQLPVELPEDITFDKPGNPLDHHPTWKHVNCPKCSKPAMRETDTFDTFIDSSWYFARFASPNSDLPFEKEAADYWLPVDHYIGGIEHAILHLLYARFFNLLLRDQKLINSSEPFKRLLTQGMVLSDAFFTKDSNGNPEWVNKDFVTGDDGQLKLNDGREVFKDGMSKMSKSKLNGIDPNIMIEKYGADTVRLYMMFTSPPEQSLEWSDTAIEGSYRFLKKIWNLISSRKIYSKNAPEFFEPDELMLRQKSHQTLKKVTNDFAERNSFNTAIASVMELLNAVPESFKKDEANDAQQFCLDEVIQFTLKMLSPITPHICLYLWKEYSDSDGNDFESNWPAVDEDFLKLDDFQLIIQVNGKVRGKEKVAIDWEQPEIEQLAKANENVKKILANAPIKKVIYVKEKLINFVI